MYSYERKCHLKTGRRERESDCYLRAKVDRIRHGKVRKKRFGFVYAKKKINSLAISRFEQVCLSLKKQHPTNERRKGGRTKKPRIRRREKQKSFP